MHLREAGSPLYLLSCRVQLVWGRVYIQLKWTRYSRKSTVSDYHEKISVHVSLRTILKCHCKMSARPDLAPSGLCIWDVCPEQPASPDTSTSDKYERCRAINTVILRSIILQLYSHIVLVFSLFDGHCVFSPLQLPFLGTCFTDF